MTRRPSFISYQVEERSLPYQRNHHRNPQPVSASSLVGNPAGNPAGKLRYCSDHKGQPAIAPEVDLAEIQPRFQPNQQVYFIGGCGTVKNCRPYAKSWTYAVEMELGPEPEMGRIGAEATILLHESEIKGLVDAA